MTDHDYRVNQLLADLAASLHSVSDEEFRALKRGVIQARRVFLAGKGRSGLQLRAFAMRLMQLGLQVHVVDDVTTPGIGPGDLLIVGSADGSPASVIAYAMRAKELKAQVAAIVTSRQSPLVEHADLVMCIDAAADSGEHRRFGRAHPLASLFEQTLGLILDLLVAELMVELQVSSDQISATQANLE